MSVALALAGCGGDEPEVQTTQPATTPAVPTTVEVRVVDGDRAVPVAGATVVALRRDVVVATVTSDAQGRAGLQLLREQAQRRRLG